VSLRNSCVNCVNPLTRHAVVIINEADQLSRDAQAALRRTMEKYMNNMRIILCANTTSKIIAPIRSRTLLVRVAAPNDDEVGTRSVHLTLADEVL
jgi:replication factor C subunit 3/5